MYHTEPQRLRTHFKARHRGKRSHYSSTNRIIFIASILTCLVSIWLSFISTDWQWFSRSGSLLVVLGIILTSNQIIENSKRLKHRRQHHNSNFNHDYAEEYKQLTLERASMLEEDIWQNGLRGLYLLVCGTLIWGFGDLVGYLPDWFG